MDFHWWVVGAVGHGGIAVFVLVALESVGGEVRWS